MKIGVDMDSVLAEIITPLDAFHNNKYNTKLSAEDHTEYRLDGLWKCSEKEVIQRIYEFYQSSFFDEIIPIKGAKEGIDILSQKHTLILISSRPFFIEHKSRAWIDIHFKDKFAKIVHTNQVSHKQEKRKRKSEVCLAEGIEIMIEDQIDYALDCANAGIKVFLLPATWNKKKKYYIQT